MEDKHDFEEKLEEFSAALVFVEKDDPASFQDGLQVLDELLEHPWAQQNPDLFERLSDFRKKLEECVFQSDSFSELMEEIEKELKGMRSDSRYSVVSAPEKVEDLETEDADSEDSESDSSEEITADSEEEVPAEPDEEELAGGWADTETAPGEHAAEGDLGLGLGMGEDRELVEDFLMEGGESLESLEVLILELERDSGNRAIINDIFRPFHTIKGVSGFLNLDDIHRLTHKVEDLLDKGRQGALIFGNKEIDIILEAVDILRRLLGGLQSRLDGDPVKDLSGTVSKFLIKLEHVQSGESGESLGEEALVEGEPQGAPEGVPPLGEILAMQGKISQDDVGSVLEEQGGDDDAGKIGELLVKQKKVSSDDVEQALRVQDALADEKTPSSGDAQTRSFIKVDMYKLDNLVNMVGELVIAQSLVQQNPKIVTSMDQRLAKDFGQLIRITGELRNTTMSLRMVPMRQTFQKMVRLVRDLAKKSDKSVHLVMSGEETEIDRNMVDVIYEPLVHMVRNSVDHGIESPAQRKEVGKPESGNLWLRADNRGGDIVIEIQDDGKGLDRERILEKARERGLVAPDETPPNHEIDQMIFRSGFSTAAQITDVSGRGVGMDVVRKTIETLRGKVEIKSTPGKGCTFVIKLPITLAIIDGMLVRVGKQTYIVPAMNIQETFRPQKKDYLTVVGRGEMIRIREKLLPLIRLHEVFDIEEAEPEPWEALVVVLECDGENHCLLVDDVLEKQEVVIKSLGEGWTLPDGVSGGTILGDGKVGLILDIGGLFSINKNQPAIEEYRQAVSE